MNSLRGELVFLSLVSFSISLFLCSEELVFVHHRSLTLFIYLVSATRPLKSHCMGVTRMVRTIDSVSRQITLCHQGYTTRAGGFLGGEPV